MTNKAYLTIPSAAARVKRDRSALDQWAKEPEVEGTPHLKVIWIHGKRYVEISNLLEVYRHKLTAPKGGKGKPRHSADT